MSNTLQGTVQN